MMRRDTSGSSSCWSRPLAKGQAPSRRVRPEGAIFVFGLDECLPLCRFPSCLDLRQVAGELLSAGPQ